MLVSCERGQIKLVQHHEHEVAPEMENWRSACRLVNAENKNKSDMALLAHDSSLLSSPLPKKKRSKVARTSTKKPRQKKTTIQPDSFQ